MSQNQIFRPSTLMYADQKYLKISILKRKILIHQKHNLLEGMLKAKKLYSCYGFSFQLKINIEIRKCS